MSETRTERVERLRQLASELGLVIFFPHQQKRVVSEYGAEDVDAALCSGSERVLSVMIDGVEQIKGENGE